MPVLLFPLNHPETPDSRNCVNTWILKTALAKQEPRW